MNTIQLDHSERIKNHRSVVSSAQVLSGSSLVSEHSLVWWGVWCQQRALLLPPGHLLGFPGFCLDEHSERAPPELIFRGFEDL